MDPTVSSPLALRSCEAAPPNALSPEKSATFSSSVSHTQAGSLRKAIRRSSSLSADALKVAQQRTNSDGSFKQAAAGAGGSFKRAVQRASTTTYRQPRRYSCAPTSGAGGRGPATAARLASRVSAATFEAKRSNALGDMFYEREEEGEQQKFRVLHPHSQVKRAFDTAMATGILVVCFEAPLRFAFSDAELGATAALRALDYALLMLCCVHMALSFATAVVVERKLIQRPSSIALVYLRGWFALDLVATLPLPLLFGPKLRWLRLVRLLLAFRLSHLQGFTGRYLLDLRLGLKSYAKICLRFFFSVLVASHWFSCLWWRIGVLNVDGGSWVVDAGLADDATTTLRERYVAAMYWSFTTMSTIGYGDIHPENAPERLFAILVMVVGAGVFTFGITTVVSAIANSNKMTAAHVEQLDHLNLFCERASLPEGLRRELRQYFLHLQDVSLITWEQQIMVHLSPQMRAKVMKLTHSSLIKSMPWFQDAPDRAVSDVLQLLKMNLFAPEEVIIYEGDVGREMYLLKQGVLQVYLEANGTIIAVMEDGAYFGEVALIKHRRRGASVKALTYAIVFSLSESDFTLVLDRHHQIEEAVHRGAEERVTNMRRSSAMAGAAGDALASMRRSSSTEAAEAAVERIQSGSVAVDATDSFIARHGCPAAQPGNGNGNGGSVLFSAGGGACTGSGCCGVGGGCMGGRAAVSLMETVQGLASSVERVTSIVDELRSDVGTIKLAQKAQGTQLLEQGQAVEEAVVAIHKAAGSRERSASHEGSSTHGHRPPSVANLKKAGGSFYKGCAEASRSFYQRKSSMGDILAAAAKASPEDMEDFRPRRPSCTFKTNSQAEDVSSTSIASSLMSGPAEPARKSSFFRNSGAGGGSAGKEIKRKASFHATLCGRRASTGRTYDSDGSGRAASPSPSSGGRSSQSAREQQTSPSPDAARRDSADEDDDAEEELIGEDEDETLQPAAGAEARRGSTLGPLPVLPNSRKSSKVHPDVGESAEDGAARIKLRQEDGTDG